MRTIITALLATTGLLAARGPITSTTFIEAGQQFVLGSPAHRGAFRVAARNVGPVPVSVAERQASGVVRERGRLEPGQRAGLAFGAGSAALVRNLGQQRAVLKFQITGSSSGLNMGYEALRE